MIDFPNFRNVSDMTYDSRDDLRAAIKAAGVQAVAEQAGVPPTTLYSFVSGKAKRMMDDTRDKVIRALEVLQADGAAPVPEDFTPVPIFDIRASAGAGALMEDGAPTAYQPYRESELSRWNLTDLAVIQVGGDSMWETLHDGDKVLVNRGERRIVKPGIYIIAYEGELLVKRCQRNLNDGSVLVSSDNPAYASFKVDEPDRLNVIGRVVWIGRALG